MSLFGSQMLFVDSKERVCELVYLGNIAELVMHNSLRMCNVHI